MKVKLVSDFHDYYDHMFDLEGTEYHRMSRTNLSRTEAFYRLREMGLQVPYWNLVKNLGPQWFPGTMVVVYTDEYSHRSEGKVLMQICEAEIKYPDCTASRCVEPPEHIQYIPGSPAARQAMSLRYLRVGNRIWWLEYWSKDRWRSNYGEVEIMLADDHFNMPWSFYDNEPYSMLAIDFVQSKYGGWYAVDYNTSPGLSHTPVEDTYPPTRIVDLIKDWYTAAHYMSDPGHTED